MSIKALKINKNYMLAVILFFLAGCSALNELDPNSSSSGKSSEVSSNNTVIGAHYAAGVLTNSTQVRAWAINNVNLTIGTGCKSNSASQTVSYTFGNTTSLGSATGNAGAFNMTPNDSTCVITINSLTLNSSNGYTTASNDGSVGTATYTFTGLTTQANAAAASPVFGTAVRSANSTTNNPSFIYAAARLSLNWAFGSAFSPNLVIYYGENVNVVSGLVASDFASIALSATSTGGVAIQAPTYCIATGYGAPCQTTNLTDAYIQLDGSSYVTYESISLYPTPSSTATVTIASYGATAGQTAQEYKIVSLGRTSSVTNGHTIPLVSGGIFYATNTTLGGAGFVGASATGGCGSVNAGSFTDNSGCTYSVVDALWNNSINSTSSVAPGINGIAFTHAYGSISNATNTFINLYYASTGTTSVVTSLYLGATPTTYFPLPSYISMDMFGFAVGTNNIGICTNGATPVLSSGSYFCQVLSKSSQASVRYLMLRHRDPATLIPTYQMFILNTGF